MKPQVVGISGSPVKNANTDRLVKHVLQSTGLDTEFIKLPSMNIRGCIACMGCTQDNICKMRDDFSEIMESVRDTKALVVGGWPPYGILDSYTKAFIERLFSLRHNKSFNKGKLAVSIVTGSGRGTPAIDNVSDQLANALSHEGLNVIGRLKCTGNVICTTCGNLETCEMSPLIKLFGGNISNAPTEYTRAEDQGVWAEAEKLGQELTARIEQNKKR